MPRVASEASVSAQVAASRARSGKPPRAADLFAQMLPDKNSACAPADRQASQTPKLAHKGEDVAARTRSQSKPAASVEAFRSENQPAAEAERPAAEFVADPPQGIGPVAAPTAAPDVTIKLPAAAAIPEVADHPPAPATASAAVVTSAPGTPVAAAPPRSAVTPALVQAADPVPVPSPALAEATFSTSQPVATPAAREAAPFTALPAPATAAGPASAAAQQRLAAEPAFDPTVLAEPVPAKLSMPTPATGPTPAKLAGVAAADSAREPAQVAEDAVAVPVKPLAARIDNAKLLTAEASDAAEPAAEGMDGETTGIAAAPATDAKPQKTVAARENGGPAPEPRVNAHADAPTPVAKPANPLGDHIQTPELKIAPLDLATAAVPSMPQSHTPAPAPAAPTQPVATVPVPVPLAGLPLAIAANAQSGNSRFEIRLDPPELGRIDVRLHFHADGQVTSHLIVDRSETLDLLRRDAADLERSLQQAGLKTSDQGMQFTLRDQSHDGEGGRRHRAASHVVISDDETATDIVTRGYTRAGQGAGIDIRV